jgi:hypothetical protein
MSSAQINALIAEKTAAADNAKFERNETLKAFDYQIANLEQEIYDLNVRLQLAEATEAFYTTEHKERTKLKWVSSSNPETYSVAIVKKDGILEVKRVTNGRGHCHTPSICDCTPCREIRLSSRLGVSNPPWLKGIPFTKTFYETEIAWLSSLPSGGSLKVTAPATSHLF